MKGLHFLLSAFSAIVGAVGGHWTYHRFIEKPWRRFLEKHITP